MERLTERFDGGIRVVTADGQSKEESKILWDAIEKLADYEDAEEQGRLIEFPVSLGQHLWFLDAYGIIRELTVNDLTVSPRGQAMLAESSEMISYYSLDHIGKSIFYTYDEAEAKLKEMEDDHD